MAANAIPDLIDADGNLRVTDKNAAALRGYHRLSRTAEVVTNVFAISLGTLETPIKEDIDKGSRLLTDAAVACGTDPEGSLRDLWDGVTGMGYAAIDMWPIDSPSQIVSGKVMHFPELEGRVNFLSFAAAISFVDTTLNGKGSTVGGPEQGAIIFGQGLEALQAGIRKLADLCLTELHSLSEQMILINERRSDIVESLRNESSHGGVDR